MGSTGGTGRLTPPLVAVSGEQSNSRPADHSAQIPRNTSETSRHRPHWVDINVACSRPRPPTSSAPITHRPERFSWSYLSTSSLFHLSNHPFLFFSFLFLFCFVFILGCCFCLTLSERCTPLLVFFSSFTTTTTTTHCSETAPATPDYQPRRPRGSRHSVTTTRTQTHARTHARTIHPPE